MPRHHMVLPHYMGRSIDIESKNAEGNQKDISRIDSLASLSPIRDIPLLLPQEADATVVNGVNHKLTAKNMNKDHLDQSAWHGDSFSFTLQKSKDENLAQDTLVKNPVSEHDFVDLESIMQMSDRSSESEKDDPDVSASECGQVGPRVPCRCQVKLHPLKFIIFVHNILHDHVLLSRNKFISSKCEQILHLQVVRSVSQWSTGASQPEESIHKAYCSLIEKAEHFIYIEVSKVQD